MNQNHHSEIQNETFNKENIGPRSGLPPPTKVQAIHKSLKTVVGNRPVLVNSQLNTQVTSSSQSTSQFNTQFNTQPTSQSSNYQSNPQISTPFNRQNSNINNINLRPSQPPSLRSNIPHRATRSMPRSIIEINKETTPQTPPENDLQLQVHRLNTEIGKLKTDQANDNFEKEKLSDQVKQLTAEREKLINDKSELETLFRNQMNTFNDKVIERENEFRSNLALDMERERSRYDEIVQQMQSKYESDITLIKEKHQLEMSSTEQINLHKLDNIKHQYEKEYQQLVYNSEQERTKLQGERMEMIKSFEEKYQQEKDNLQQEREEMIKSLQDKYQQEQSNYNQERIQLINQIESLQSQVKSYENTLEKQNNQIDTLQISLTHLKESSSNQITSLQNTLSQLTESTTNHQSIEQTQQLTIQQLQLQLASSEEQRETIYQKLLKEEMIRRKLHNQVLELKGNIRVFCRIRPLIPSEPSSPAQLSFPDQDLECQQLFISDSSKVHQFSFDKVFTPLSSNEDIFQETSDLVQSSLDGYNVCIFAYGQTGSGKTYTMSSIIPNAVNKIFETSASLKEKGWNYELTGEFLEIYNETMIDLLTTNHQSTDKLEIRHDTKLQKTTITNITTVELDSPSTVYSLIKRAANSRTVAATAANERSSRSHSIFIMRLKGHNSVTGKTCEGTLNLIDLAGSERLTNSQTTGIRLKETQNINKSLSYLGDVICALGDEDKSHIPYRNCKLTYLLQYSLSGNSKTLMFVNVSPLETHVNESLSSLRFATKVNKTKMK